MKQLDIEKLALRFMLLIQKEIENEDIDDDLLLAAFESVLRSLKEASSSTNFEEKDTLN